MKLKKIVLGAVVIAIGLPLTAFLVAFVWISALDETNGALVSSGETREYLLHVPESYDPAEPTPLVISLHAGYTWPAHQMNLSRWNRLADEDGFIVVYPSATGFPSMWHTFRTGEGLEKDVRFIADLIDTLRTQYRIDPERIYANGMSNGGGMAFAVACALPDRIAAVGLVAPAQALPSDWCAATRPVPMMAFHGTADGLVPYGGGPLGDPLNPVKPEFAAARDWVGRWARRNRCAATPVESTVASDVARLEYADCAEGAAVVLYTVLGGGHTWPGGKPMPAWRVGPTSDGIDATREMWAFFREHRLGGAASATR